MMLDLETLGTRPGCVVYQISAVMFRWPECEPPPVKDAGCAPGRLTMWPDVGEQLEIGLLKDPETMRWWESKGGLPHRGEGVQTPAIDAAEKLIVWCYRYRPEAVWMWGADFDGPVLASFFQACGFDRLPWEYWRARDARTVWRMAFAREDDGVERSRYDGPHCAEADACNQIDDLRKAMVKLGLTLRCH